MARGQKCWLYVWANIQLNVQGKQYVTSWVVFLRKHMQKQMEKF